MNARHLSVLIVGFFVLAGCNSGGKKVLAECQSKSGTEKVETCVSTCVNFRSTASEEWVQETCKEAERALAETCFTAAEGKTGPVACKGACEKVGESAKSTAYAKQFGAKTVLGCEAVSAAWKTGK